MKEYYQKNYEEVIQELNTNKNGLNKIEVDKRLKQYGKNELPTKKIDSFFKILVRQLKDPIVCILVITVIFSFMIGETIDAWTIMFIILVDLLMGTYQERKACQNAQSLTKMIQVYAKVLRDGNEHEIKASELVVGDIVLLEPGNKISADLRIIESQNLQVDESILTGESLNVEKNNLVINNKVGLSETKNMVYAGTSVITGRGKAVVVKTGIDTEIGKIADKVTNTTETKSPLTLRMEKFSKQIGLLIIILAIIITIILFFNGYAGNEIFLSVIALSVSAMPEGLPLALTMALTIASNRMAKQNVIVKKLNSAESLGSCTIIASDKTGTLTVNEQTAKKIVLPDDSIYDIEGTGYQENGTIITNGHSLSPATDLAFLGTINNEAYYDSDINAYCGDSIDVAFLVLGKKLAIQTNTTKILDDIPYESEKKYSAVFYQKEGCTHCTIKGSLEKVLEFSTSMQVGNEVENIDVEKLNRQNENLASMGYRVIAIADGVFEGQNFDEEEINNLTIMGLVAFIDPVREEVKASINECKKAGIKVVMITGDHPLTALAIAKELSLASSLDEVTTGTEVLEFLQKGEKEFDDFVKTKKVFTRVTPMDKLEIVKSYERQQEFVAVTGDGVNDAPAIKTANLGIAMGSGTDVAKETASMIIIDDNFKSIVAGIKEGRTAYSNIRKISYMLLSCGLAEVLFFVLSVIFKLPMPLVAIQLLWLNLVTDGLQDFALSFEKAEFNLMNEKPRKTDESLFDRSLLKEVIVAGLTIGVLVFGLWYYLVDVVNMEIYMARSYVMVLMVFMQNIHVLNCRSEKNSIFKCSFKSNPLVIFSIVSSVLLQIVVMEVPVLSSFLKVHTVPMIDMIKLLLLSSIVLIVMELYKLILRKNK